MNKIIPWLVTGGAVIVFAIVASFYLFTKQGSTTQHDVAQQLTTNPTTTRSSNATISTSSISSDASNNLHETKVNSTGKQIPAKGPAQCVGMLAFPDRSQLEIRCIALIFDVDMSMTSITLANPSTTTTSEIPTYFVKEKNFKAKEGSIPQGSVKSFSVNVPVPNPDEDANPNASLMGITPSDLVLKKFTITLDGRNFVYEFSPRVDTAGNIVEYASSGGVETH